MASDLKEWKWTRRSRLRKGLFPAIIQMTTPPWIGNWTWIPKRNARRCDSPEKWALRSLRWSNWYPRADLFHMLILELSFSIHRMFSRQWPGEQNGSPWGWQEWPHCLRRGNLGELQSTGVGTRGMTSYVWDGTHRLVTGPGRRKNLPVLTWKESSSLNHSSPS